ncbi:collagen binding domain-containing protein [Bacillus cereus]
MVRGLERGRFSKKGGSIYPENTSEVQWILSVNPNSEQLNTDIVLYDSLQEGQLLNKDSFSMYVNDKVYLTLIDFESSRLWKHYVYG